MLSTQHNYSFYVFPPTGNISNSKPALNPAWFHHSGILISSSPRRDGQQLYGVHLSSYPYLCLASAILMLCIRSPHSVVRLVSFAHAGSIQVPCRFKSLWTSLINHGKRLARDSRISWSEMDYAFPRVDSRSLSEWFGLWHRDLPIWRIHVACLLR